MMKITVVTPTYNEASNIKLLYEKLRIIFDENDSYVWTLLVIDNASTDGTIQILKEIAKRDARVRLIINTRNFGHIRSPYWGILNGGGDATIYMASDLQDPPELLIQFVNEWKKGWKVVYGVKPISREGWLVNKLRKIYYMIMSKICDYPIIHNATGFGLYDKKVIDHIKNINDPYPFLRGLVSELGYPIKTIEFIQDIRRQDQSKNNFITLYQFAIFSIVSQSTFPIRFISLVGFSTAVVSILVLIFYIVLKLSYWYEYPTGLIPAICLITLFFSILLTILGIFGEYLLVMLTYLKNRPVVVESERVNFNED